MGHAADLGEAEFEAGFVTAQIITHQLGLPILQEVVSMLTGAAGAEVVDDSCCFAELAGGVGPDIRTVGFLRDWHRCTGTQSGVVRRHRLHLGSGEMALSGCCAGSLRAPGGGLGIVGSRTPSWLSRHWIWPTSNVEGLRAYCFTQIKGRSTRVVYFASGCGVIECARA